MLEGAVFEPRFDMPILELIKKYTGKLSTVFNEMYPEDKTLSSLFNKYISKDVWGEIWEQAISAATERLSQSSIPS